jgi:dihydroflavonol-4-reductase
LSNLVTGGSGFIGGHLVRLLAERGEPVRVLDLRRPSVPVAGADYVHGSITDPAVVERATAGCRRVFHLAAHAGLWTADKRDFVAVNVAGTRNVLRAARAAGVDTVVHTATESILVDVSKRTRQTVHERTSVRLDRLAGPYCVGKALAEREALTASRDSGQRVIVCSPTVPLGPGDPWLTPPTRMLLGFLARRYPAYLPTTLNVVDVRDVALGHWLAAERGTSGARYILGGRDVPLAELLDRLERLTGVAMPKRTVPYALALAAAHAGEWLADRVTRRPPAAPVTGVRLAGADVRFDNRATRAALNWAPRPPDASLADAVDDYVRRGLFAPPASGQQPKRAR